MFVKFIAHAKETNSILDNVMKEVLIVNVSLFAIFLGNFRKQNSSDSWKVSRGWKKKTDKGKERVRFYAIEYSRWVE